MPWAAWAIIALTLLAPALGGSTEVWAQALIAVAVGLLLVVAPPKKSLGLLPNICFIALLLIALTAFFPVHWFGAEGWRAAFSNFGISLPQTRSAQPWLTLQSTLLFVLGLAWIYYLFAYDWNRRSRERAWRAYSFGILALASALIIAFVAKERIPFWPNVPEFGFFPNRNQTSNVLGLGGVMIYAWGLRRFQENRKYWWLWLASLSLLCWALILNYSRAGIILFFFGAVTVHIYWWSGEKGRQRPLVAFGGLILLVALFIIDGGATLARFGGETADFFSPSRNARLSIYRDALILLTKSPPLGIGLANFPPVFAMHRQYSIADNDVIHPESDWLWAAVEMGWLAPLLLLILFVWWLKQCLPFEPGTSRLMRAAAMICGCAFAVHGMFDVSGHRIGALWPALFLAGTALHPRSDSQSSAAIARVFQILGTILALVGVWWFASALGAKTLPTSATWDRLEKRIDAAGERDDYPAVLELASEALRIAPLEWSLYYKRGAAQAALFHSRNIARRDFAVARYLLPYWPDLCLQEGETWIAVGEPDFAFDAWTEALRRSPQKAPDFYARMFARIKSDATLRDRWRELGHANKEYLLIFLQNAGPFEFEIELERLLGEDPELHSLTSEELKLLFSAWYEKGDKLRLAQTLQEHPEWQKLAWRQLARAYAGYQDYRPAYETLRRFVSPPNVPRLNPDESSIVLQSRFRINPTNLNEGFALYWAQINEGKIDDALATLESLVLLHGSPKYLWYLEAELWAQKKNWQKAWQALQRYAFGSA